MELHVLGTRWAGGEAWIRTVDADGEARLLPTKGPFAWTVHEGFRCTGYWDGAWRPCPDQLEVGPEAQCLACFRGQGDPDRASDDPFCIFEPRCMREGIACRCSFGSAGVAPVPHAVYLAFYATLPKVGMTKLDRLEERLQEQGADAYIRIAATEDRASARHLEKQVSALYKIPEWRTHKETLPQLTRPVPTDAIEDRAAHWAETLGKRYAVDAQIHWLHHSIVQPLAARPDRVPAVGRHAGRWIGAKGHHLFYEAAPEPGRLDVGGARIAAIPRGELGGRIVDVA